MLAKLTATNSKHRKQKQKALEQQSPIKTQLCSNDQIKGVASPLKLSSQLVPFC